MEKVPVSELLLPEAKDLELKLIYGKKSIHTKYLTNYRIQKPGLALAGYTDHIHSGRVQILGNTEISYLSTLPEEVAFENLKKLCSKDIACFVVTKNLKIPHILIDIVKDYEVPLFKTTLLSSIAIAEITSYLEDRLAPEIIIHGVLLDVHGVGVLIIGRSGIGKSECALELIKRGHRLIADDAVHINRKQDYLVGTSNDLLKYNIEVRGLGILNVKDMYGVNAIRLRKRVEVVVNFIDWKSDEYYDRTGLDNQKYDILGLKLPMITLPVSPGRNMAVIVEAAAKNHLLKYMGYDAAKEFEEKLLKKIENNRKVEIKKVMRTRGVE
jgi:HPr kinase/phosphorylase